MTNFIVFSLAAQQSNNMVRINGGTFTMGSPANENGHEDDEVQHQVTVSSFYMGKYQVTQKEYQEVMGANPSYFKGDNLPVEQVSWFEAIIYCNLLSIREGLTQVYKINTQRDRYDNVVISEVIWNRNANGYRLPTEAEWEYACRAGTRTPFSTGNTITKDQANYDVFIPYNPLGSERRGGTTRVGYFPANPWGLHDMHGNVLEWCWDWYGDYQSGTQTNPIGAVSGTRRVLRGGAWCDSLSSISSSRRDSSNPYSKNINYSSNKLMDGRFGFRLARN